MLHSSNDPDVRAGLAAIRAAAGDALLVGEVYLAAADAAPFLDHLGRGLRVRALPRALVRRAATARDRRLCCRHRRAPDGACGLGAVEPRLRPPAHALRPSERARGCGAPLTVPTIGSSSTVSSPISRSPRRPSACTTSSNGRITLTSLGSPRRRLVSSDSTRRRRARLKSNCASCAGNPVSATWQPYRGHGDRPRRARWVPAPLARRRAAGARSRRRPPRRAPRTARTRRSRSCRPACC